MKENKLKKVISIGLLITLILVIAGISLAYFLARINGTEEV